MNSLNEARTSSLIVYNLHPEEVQFFVIPNAEISPEQRELLALANNTMVNCDASNPGTDFLSNALASDEDYCMAMAPQEQKCIWYKYLIDLEERLYGSGFSDRSRLLQRVLPMNDIIIAWALILLGIVPLYIPGKQ